jgi:hypothetical protein
MHLVAQAGITGRAADERLVPDVPSVVGGRSVDVIVLDGAGRADVLRPPDVHAAAETHTARTTAHDRQ